ncbi:MAG: biopolymer transporter ExbD [Puia sp.]|nr:biopolymer transporter ExbD [Puia sp.]
MKKYLIWIPVAACLLMGFRSKIGGSKVGLQKTATVASARLVILIFDQAGIYAYDGDDVKTGKTYTRSELRSLLEEKKSDSLLTVLIKSAENTTYNNTVNTLDELKRAGIFRYALVDISSEEQSYIGKLGLKTAMR